MEFKYETHLHTREGSKCGVAKGKDYIKPFIEAGYSGIIVTDHFFNGNTAVPDNLPWKERVDLFCLGYENAAEEGYKLGFDVFFGWEARFPAGSEFLTYGLDKQWLYDHEDILSWTPEEQYANVTKDGGMIIQAHPFREASYIDRVEVYPHAVDGVEGVNYGNNTVNKEFNRKALEYAKKYDFPITGGSDIHSLPVLPGGMIFDHKLTDIQDFIRSVKNKKGKVIGIEEFLGV